MSRISKRLRPSPAAMIAVVALVFAVSGVAVALPGKNTVATKDIKKNAVTAAKIKNGAVTEAKLGDGAVTTSKLGNDAVTGAKVNEATLGKVPSATTAETATKATTAESAAKATTADNALELDGRTLTQVRPVAVGIKDESSQGLDDTTFENVMGVNVSVPTGGGSIVANAALELDNDSGGQAGVTCRLKIDGSVASSSVFMTMTDEHNYSMPLTAIDPSAGAGLRQVLVECQGSIGDDDIKFVNGDLTVQAFPIGA